jgi:hypothetical protein
MVSNRGKQYVKGLYTKACSREAWAHSGLSDDQR